MHEWNTSISVKWLPPLDCILGNGFITDLILHQMCSRTASTEFIPREPAWLLNNAEHPCNRNDNAQTPSYIPNPSLVHLPDESVNVLLPVAKVTALNEVLELPRTEAASRVAELKGPEEVGGLLEVGAHGEDLVDKILHADDAVLAEVLLNDGVVSKRNALLVDLAITPLVDKLLDALEVRVAVGDPRLNNLDHL